jgi:hypothetical protein
MENAAVADYRSSFLNIRLISNRRARPTHMLIADRSPPLRRQPAFDPQAFQAAALVGLLLLLAGCSGADNAVNPRPLSSAAAAATPVPVELAGTPPASVTVEDAYRFQPTVTQGNGPIEFSIQNPPPWASFDTATGVLTGTPTSADVGISGGIVISAANGASAASIGPFMIRVDTAAAPAGGTATLMWTAPTQNIDGTALTNLAGYHVHYGMSPSALMQTIDLADETATSYVVSGLSAGTYYFSVDAYNSWGIESAPSNIATKTL